MLLPFSPKKRVVLLFLLFVFFSYSNIPCFIASNLVFSFLLLDISVGQNQFIVLIFSKEGEKKKDILLPLSSLFSQLDTSFLAAKNNQNRGEIGGVCVASTYLRTAGKTL